jgi:hypothetical protein
MPAVGTRILLFYRVLTEPGSSAGSLEPNDFADTGGFSIGSRQGEKIAISSKRMWENEALE